jgi:hypothetical protein
VQAAYLTLVQKSSEHHHKSTLELLHLNAFNTLPLFLTMSLLLGEPASVSASLMTEDLSFYVVFVILIRKFKGYNGNLFLNAESCQECTGTLYKKNFILY